MVPPRQPVHIRIPHAPVHVRKRIHLCNDREQPKQGGGKLHFEEIQKVDDPLFLDKRRHNQHQTFDATGNVRGKSRDGSIVYQDVLSARSRLFPLVYLGAMADIPAHKHDKDENGKNRAVRSKSLTGFLPVDWPEIFCINKAVAMLKYFMLGVFLINWPRWLDSAKKIPGMIPVCALPVLFACTLLVRNDILTGLMGYILPLAGIHTICVISARIKSLKHITQKLLVVSASSYIIYLFHTTFEGFVKSLVQQVPLLANGNDPLYFSVGAAAVIGAGIFLPIILHRYILQRNRLLRFLFGLKPAK